MLRQIPARLEITFLSIATRWMSESRLAQQVLIEAYNMNRSLFGNRRQITRRALIFIAAGWLLGFILGMLTY